MKTQMYSSTPRIGNGPSFETLMRGEGILNATSRVFSNLQAKFEVLSTHGYYFKIWY
jgi:hypothetical protein